MTPQEKVEALLKKTVASGCPVGEVIAANEMAVRLAQKYRIPSSSIKWPDLPEGYVWQGAKIVPGVSKPKAQAAPPPPPPKQAPRPATRGASLSPRGDAAKTALRLVERAQGATVAELVAATGWQPHSVRGWVSIQNTLRRANGDLPILSVAAKGGRRYKVM